MALHGRKTRTKAGTRVGSEQPRGVFAWQVLLLQAPNSALCHLQPHINTWVFSMHLETSTRTLIFKWLGKIRCLSCGWQLGMAARLPLPPLCPGFGLNFLSVGKSYSLELLILGIKHKSRVKGSSPAAARHISPLQQRENASGWSCRNMGVQTQTPQLNIVRPVPCSTTSTNSGIEP